jgi:hypothetical protein
MLKKKVCETFDPDHRPCEIADYFATSWVFGKRSFANALSVMARRQSLSSFCATTLKYEAASLRAHPFTKTVCFSAPAIVRLKSSLHISSSFILFLFPFSFFLYPLPKLDVYLPIQEPVALLKV